MTVEELTEIGRGLGNVIICTPVKGGGSQRYWDYPHYSKIPGFKTTRSWPALDMDTRRNELFQELLASAQGQVALISILTNDGDHGQAVSYLMGFSQQSDAVMFRLSWGA